MHIVSEELIVSLKQKKQVLKDLHNNCINVVKIGKKLL